jgi:hypothetical protein
VRSDVGLHRDWRMRLIIGVEGRTIGAIACAVALAGTLAACGWSTVAERSRCHPSYKGACLDPNAFDYDCKGGKGDGPRYTGPVRVVGDDPFRLDRDGDGRACEWSD